MSGGGMGQLEPNQKYVIVVEVYGKKSKTEGDDFDNVMKQLKDKFGAQVKVKLHATKNEGDPPSGP
jgi:hypothetical protein